MNVSFIDLCVHFAFQLECACAYVLHKLKTEKKAFEVNSQNIRQEIGIQVNFMLEINFKSTFFSKL